MKILNFIIPALFGLIGIFAFAPFSIKFLIFISYGYLIRLLISNNNGVFRKVFCWGLGHWGLGMSWICLLYTSPSPRDLAQSRMPSSA